MGIDRYHTLSISMPYFGWMNMHEYQLYPAYFGVTTRVFNMVLTHTNVSKMSGIRWRRNTQATFILTNCKSMMYRKSFGQMFAI